MHITMIKKRLADGSDCRKCIEATDLLKARGLWDRIDEVVWAHEGIAESEGMQIASALDVDRAPFFVVRDAGAERVYTSVLRLIRERFPPAAPAQPTAAARVPARATDIDVDDIGGI